MGRQKVRQKLSSPIAPIAGSGSLQDSGAQQSPLARLERIYECAIDQFITWYCSEPRLAFNRIVVRALSQVPGIATSGRQPINQQPQWFAVWLTKPPVQPC
jgi:hypothetical protein